MGSSSPNGAIDGNRMILGLSLWQLRRLFFRLRRPLWRPGSCPRSSRGLWILGESDSVEGILTHLFLRKEHGVHWKIPSYLSIDWEENTKHWVLRDISTRVESKNPSNLASFRKESNVWGGSPIERNTHMDVDENSGMLDFTSKQLLLMCVHSPSQHGKKNI